MADSTSLFYRLRYLRDGYILADAFRPYPFGLEKTFQVQADALPPHSDAEIIQIATETAPQGYWLQRIDAIGGEPHVRNVFAKAVPLGSRAVA